MTPRRGPTPTAATSVRKPTLSDVARLAHVSVKTASNVANGYIRVSDTTRHRVQQVIDELGYQPDPIARALRRRGCETLTLIAPTIGTELSPAAVQLIQLAAGLGFRVVTRQSETGDDRLCLLVVTGNNHDVATSWIPGLEED